MTRVRGKLILVFTIASVLVLGGLAGVTALVFDLEFAERDARGDTGHQVTLQRALWRMDAWLGPLLVTESARDVDDYVSSERVGSSDSPYQKLHFELRADDEASLSGTTVRSGETLALDLASYGELDRELELAESTYGRLLSGSGSASDLTSFRRQAPADYDSNISERSRRAQNTFENRSNFRLGDVTPGHEVGFLFPLWIERDGAPAELVFVRRVSHSSRGALLQGFVADWENVKAAMLAEVDDLLPGADLKPIAFEGTRDRLAEYGLATLPAVLVADRETTARDLSRPARVTLIVAWAAALIALVAAGMTLRSSLVYGEKRHRFASSVTHELRTPLTTFRMYSEMLSKDMIPEERRSEYLATLQEEAGRLSHLVENVLAYAQLEEGRAAVRVERVELTELLRRVVPAIERQAQVADARLVVRTPDDSREVETDVEAVGQILFNLVDNACKYGRTDDGCDVEVAIEVNGHELVVTVADHGPGVPRSARGAIFRPFERGEREAADPTPGVGLGLALCRGMVRDLGGDLTLDENGGAGATFRFRLPV